ncbi:hypothetical protein HK105_203718 [Polyrhizophydium stewartii]|uniref:DNA helicase n=1 Tax=Polyrhizophydium stewartii TaxID=2732419 RepID=A0ABR4NAY4_9FUNG
MASISGQIGAPNTSGLNSSCIERPLHLLVVTDGYSPLVPRFLAHIGSLKRCVSCAIVFSCNRLIRWLSRFGIWRRHESAKMPPLCTSRQDHKGTYIQAGACSACKDGVMLVQLDLLSASDIAELGKHLHYGQATSVGQGDVCVRVNHNHAVWVVLDLGPLPRATNTLDEQTLMETIPPKLSGLIGEMDIVINLRSSSSDEINEALACEMLVHETEPESHSSSPHVRSELARLLADASRIQAVFIATFVTLARKMFPETGQSIVGSVHRLARMASAHARLCMRTEAHVDDAVVAVMLLEETCAFVCGSSVLGFRSMPQDGENLLAMYAEDAGTQPGFESRSSSYWRDPRSCDGSDQPHARKAMTCFRRMFRHILRVFDRLAPAADACVP